MYQEILTRGHTSGNTRVKQKFFFVLSVQGAGCPSWGSWRRRDCLGHRSMVLLSGFFNWFLFLEEHVASLMLNMIQEPEELSIFKHSLNAGHTACQWKFVWNPEYGRLWCSNNWAFTGSTRSYFPQTLSPTTGCVPVSSSKNHEKVYRSYAGPALVSVALVLPKDTEHIIQSDRQVNVCVPEMRWSEMTDCFYLTLVLVSSH